MFLRISPDVVAAVDLLLAQSGVKFRELIEAYEERHRDEGVQSRWLSMKEAIILSRSSRWTIMRWAHAEKIKVTKLSAARSGKILVDRASLEAWLASGTLSED